MIDVLINNQPQQVAGDASIESIVALFAADGPFAVALNGQFVSKSDYQTTIVAAKDKIDILSPIQGG